MLTQLQGKLDQLDERILADQRMVRALEKLDVVHGRAGYRYEEPDEIDSDLTKRMERIVGPVAGPFATGPRRARRPSPTTTPRSTALQRDEVAIARADFDCEQQDITPVEAIVRPQYEAEFRQRNQTLSARSSRCAEPGPASTAGAATAGSASENALPAPSSSSTQTRPPWASAISRQIASPRPLPPRSRPRAGSTR